MKCATIGCKHQATMLLTYTMQGQAETDKVCGWCAAAYVTRPSLKASAVYLPEGVSRVS